MVQLKAKIVHNKIVQANYFHCAVAAAKIASLASPGQFVNIKVSDSIEPLLRRPFSIHRVSMADIEILYEIVGPGTEILSQKNAGEYLDIIGPLGTGFTFNDRPRERQTERTILVAGGMGVAPLLFLAEKLKKHNPLVLLGVKTKSQILCEKDFKDLGCEVRIATDDGSRGFKGKVTDLLKHLPSTIDHRPSTIYACGPRPMLKEISLVSKKHNIPAQISLEEHMACGIGACLGCAVKTKSGFQRVCKEGPVFAADEII